MDQKTKTKREELEEVEAGHKEVLSRFTLEAARCAKDGYTFELLSPIVIGSATVQSLKFRPQTVQDIREAKAALREAEAKKDPKFDMDEWLIARLTGVSVEALGQLDWEDFDACQAVLLGFTRRRAASGPTRTG